MLERRTLLRRLASIPAASAFAPLPVLAAATPRHGALLPMAATDPWVLLATEHARLNDLVCAAVTEAESDTAYDAWIAVERRFGEVAPMSIAGALCGIRLALADYREFTLSGNEPADQGESFMVALLTGAIGLLEREVANA